MQKKPVYDIDGFLLHSWKGTQWQTEKMQKEEF